MKSKHVVSYVGGGIWKDGRGELWGKSGNPSIKQSRQYETDKDQDGFLDDRGDISFMVKYGQMNINTISIEEEDKNDGKEGGDANGGQIDGKTDANDKTDAVDTSTDGKGDKKDQVVNQGVTITPKK